MKNTQVLLTLVAGSSILAVSHAYASAYSDAVNASNPAVYWQLNESSGATTVTDSSTHGVSGTVMGSPTFGVSGVPGISAGNTAMGFSGTNTDSYIRCTSPGLTGACTLEGWFKTSSSSGAIIADSSASSDSIYSTVGITNGHISFTQRYGGNTLTSFTAKSGTQTYAGSVAWVTYETNYTVNDNAWHYFALTYQPDTADTDNNSATVSRVDLYVDPTSTTPYATLYSSVGFVYFGRLSLGAVDRKSGGIALLSNSSMDEVAIYNSALDGDTVLSHFQAAVPECSALALLGIGGLIMQMRRREC